MPVTPEQALAPQEPAAGARALQDSVRRAIVRGRMLADLVRPVLAAEDLSLEGWLVLTSLADQNGLIMSEIAERTLGSNATLTRHVDALAQRALVYREVVPDDRRQIAIHLSQRGTALVTSMTERIADVARRLDQDI